MAATLVQSNIATAGGGGTTLGVILNGIVAGHAIGLIDSFDFSGGGTASISDGSTNSTPIDSINIGGFNQFLESSYYKNYVGGNKTFTLTNTLSNTNRSITVLEVAGVDTINALGGHATHTGTELVETSSNSVPTPTLNGSLAIGGGNLNTGSTVNSPFTDVQVDSTVSFTWSSFLQQAVAAAVAATWTQGTNASYQALIFVFNPTLPGTVGITKGRGPLGKRERRRRTKNAFVAVVAPPVTPVPTRTLTGVGI